MTKKIEVIEQVKTEFTDWQMDKIISEEEIVVLLRNVNKSPIGVVSCVKYKNIGQEYKSQFLSWKNLFFCSNNYGVSPEYEYMNCAVQNNLKTAATVYMNSKDEYQKIVSALPDGYHVNPYNAGEKKYEYPDIVFLYREGCLSDYFDMDKIQELYEKHNVTGLNWSNIKAMAQWEMERFSEEAECGFDIQCGAREDEQKVILGLLLGYPIESTIAHLKGTIDVFLQFLREDVRKHFEESDAPDKLRYLNNTWVKKNGVIYIEGQEESLYFD